MKLQALEPPDLHVGMRIAVSTPFDARVWVKMPDGDFGLSQMEGFVGDDDNPFSWAEVVRLNCPTNYAWLDVDVDDEGTQAIRVYVDTRTLRLWFDEEDKP